MPLLAERAALLEGVETELHALEALCGTLESAMMRRSWAELNAAIADSRRVTHALQNALDDARAVRTPAYDEEIFRRIRYVYAIRQNQMTRLQQFGESVTERLQLISRFKSAARSMASGERPAQKRLGSLDRLT